MRTSTPGKSASKNPEKNEGLTLIELLVAIAIIGLIFAIGATALRSVFGVRLKESASQLASTLRYVSQKAVMDHLYIRLVYDLDRNSYRVEESTEPQVIDPAAYSDEEQEKQQEKQEEKEAPFVVSESRLLHEAQLPSDVRFQDVQVSYLSEKREKGVIASYFFPDGYATPTLVHLQEDDSRYTVELFPSGGRVRIVADYQETFGQKEEP